MGKESKKGQAFTSVLTDGGQVFWSPEDFKRLPGVESVQNQKVCEKHLKL